MKGKKVLVGLSGGVDSAVCALILKKQNYDVSTATMILHDGSSVEKDISDAKAISEHLNLQHYILDFRNEFQENVVSYFKEEYMSGRTPNPCIRCNETMKFGKMLDFALENGFDYIATGHYSKIEFDEKLDRWLLKDSEQSKDQSYFLYRLNQKQLRHTLMPLSNYSKDYVRNLAKEANLPVANKSDSQEICFISDDNYKKFLLENSDCPAKSGNFIDEKNRVIGKHKGIMNYTIGQRKGLGLSLGKPMFVSEINIQNNTVKLSEKEGLFSKALIAENINWIYSEKIEKETRVQAKIRFRKNKEPALIIPIDKNQLEVVFDEPQLSVAPGQSVVFYENNIVLGGGIIVKGIKG